MSEVGAAVWGLREVVESSREATFNDPVGAGAGIGEERVGCGAFYKDISSTSRSVPGGMDTDVTDLGPF